MKQGNFIIEFVQTGDSVLYFVRTTNGQIVNVCHDVSTLSLFFEDTEKKILSNFNSNNDGKA